MKQRPNKKISVILLCNVISLCLIASVSFAWFINNREAEISSGENMLITVGSKLEVCLYGKDTWASKAELNMKKTIPDITGDGETFYYPVALDENDMPVLNKPETFIALNDPTVDAEQFYLTVKLKFRTSVSLNMYLAEDSFVDGENMDEAETDDLTHTINSDVIAGAVRVGFYELVEREDQTTEEVLKFIWIPNETYQVTFVDPGYSFTTEGETEAYGYLWPDNGTLDESTGQMEAVTWSPDDYESGRVLVGNDRLAPAGAAESPDSQPLLSFTCADGLEEKVLIIRIWIEGTDREALSTLNGGHIRYRFNFVGVLAAGDANE